MNNAVMWDLSTINTCKVILACREMCQSLTICKLVLKATHIHEKLHLTRVQTINYKQIQSVILTCN